MPEVETEEEPLLAHEKSLIKWAAIQVYAEQLLATRQPESMPPDFAAALERLRKVVTGSVA